MRNKITKKINNTAKNTGKFILNSTIKPLVINYTQEIMKELIKEYFMIETNIIFHVGVPKEYCEYIYNSLNIKNFKFYKDTPMYSKFYFIKEYNCILEVKPVETIIEGSKSRVQKFYLYRHKSNISKLNKKIDNIIDDYNKRFHKNDIISLYNNGSFVRTISNNDIAKFNYISKYKSIICTQVKNHIKYFEESNMNHISNRGISFLLYGNLEQVRVV